MDSSAGMHDAERCPGPNGRSGPGCIQFPPPCPWDVPENGVHHLFNWTTDGDGMGACSSDWVIGLISDHVLLPKDLAPGAYVLGWRWDCEETAQIWQNCADVEIAKAA